MSQQTMVRVVIHGTEFSFRTDNPAYINDLAGFVNEQIEKITASGKVKSSSKAIVLAAFNIADELFKLRKDHAALSTSFMQRIDGMLKETEQAYKAVTLPVEQK